MAILLGAKALQSCLKMREEGKDFIFLYQPALRCELSPKHNGPYTLNGKIGKTAPLAKSNSSRKREAVSP